MSFEDRFIGNNGVRIHYEVNDDAPENAPPLVLMHGMGGSTRNWHDAGYTDALSGEFRLILIDSRGFGQSDKLTDPADYGRQQKVSDVTAVLDDIGIDKTFYWGYSMGASIGWALGMLAPHRFHALVLGSYPVIPLPVPEFDRARWQARAKIMRLGMDVYVTALEMDGGALSERQKERLLANDKNAYAAQQLANLDWGAPDEDIVNMTLPTFVYAGTKDIRNHEPAKRCASLAPNASFLSLPDHTHAQAFQVADTMIPHVREFIAGVRAAR